MVTISDYLAFVRSKGRALSVINPGSDEVALSVDEALEAIGLLEDSQLPVLGGDILSTESGRLIYAYQLWGSGYHCLSWYCDKLENESDAAYAVRSYELAKKAISKAANVAKKLSEDCFVVLIV